MSSHRLSFYFTWRHTVGLLQWLLDSPNPENDRQYSDPVSSDTSLLARNDETEDPDDDTSVVREGNARA